jgi:transcriptional/translational regulatory protein YebC/TACO1
VLGGAGTAGWAFDRKGSIQLAKSTVSEDKLMDVAVGAGADDYADLGDEWTVTTPPDSLDHVLKALEAANIPVKSSGLGYLPKNKKPVGGREAEVCLNLAEAIDDHDDVQNVYSDFDISDEELRRIAGE